MADLERTDPGHVGLPGEYQKIRHQLVVIGEDRGDGNQAIELRQLAIALRFGKLDAPLDVANRIEILVDLAAVGRAEPPAQALHVIGDGIEHAAIRQTRLRATAIAEQPLEDRARAVLHR